MPALSRTANDTIDRDGARHGGEAVIFDSLALSGQFRAIAADGRQLATLGRRKQKPP